MGNLAIHHILGIILGAAIPEKLGLSFAVPLTFLALLVNDFRKFINVIVIIISGLVATFGYNYIPFKAYVIVAALAGLFTAMILTRKIKSMSNCINFILWIDYLFNKVFHDSFN